MTPLVLPVRLGRVTLRATTERDLPFVLETEGATDFVRHWAAEEHRALLLDPRSAHWIIEAQGRPVGYLILRGLGTPDRCVELKRINLAEPGRGWGRESLRLLKKVVFQELGAHRLWLDVMAHNERACRLYLSEGFAPEGTMREALRSGDRYVDLVLMSILEGEYRTSTA